MVPFRLVTNFVKNESTLRFGTGSGSQHKGYEEKGEGKRCPKTGTFTSPFSSRTLEFPTEPPSRRPSGRDPCTRTMTRGDVDGGKDGVPVSPSTSPSLQVSRKIVNFDCLGREKVTDQRVKDTEKDHCR